MPAFRHIIGPPGTGKTSALLSVMEEHLAIGTPPDRIAYCSFTRAAMREAIRRATRAFRLEEDDLPYVRTMHSMCYRHLGLVKSELVTAKKWREFCDGLGIRCTSQDVDAETLLDEPWEPVLQEEGDVLRAWYDWARNGQTPLEVAAWEFDPPTGFNWQPSRALWFAREYEAWKREARLFDFCDMLEEVLRLGWAPPVDVLIVDEAQDLSVLQRTVFRSWAAKIPEVWLAYDDDQCIYQWQHADPKWLLSLPGERRVLVQSHRVPRLVAHVAQELISRNKIRHPKRWLPRPAPGHIDRAADLDQLVGAMADRSRTWHLLTRNRCYLSQYTERLQRAGIPYTHLRGRSLLPHADGSVIAALRLANGQAVSLRDVRLLAQDTPAKPYWLHGVKERLKELPRQDGHREDVTLNSLFALGATSALVNSLSSVDRCLEPLKLAQGVKDYYLRAFRRYGLSIFEQRPHVVVSTIHGVKGQQAHHVVLLLNMTRRTAEGYVDDPEPERRVWYVGLTRAIESVHLIEPMGGGWSFDEL